MGRKIVVDVADFAALRTSSVINGPLSLGLLAVKRVCTRKETEPVQQKKRGEIGKRAE